jgi:hypothetical protein
MNECLEHFDLDLDIPAPIRRIGAESWCVSAHEHTVAASRDAAT